MSVEAKEALTWQREGLGSRELDRVPARQSVSQYRAADQAACGVGIIGLAGIALIHILDIGGKLTETPYMFWMYIGLIAASMVVSGMLLRGASKTAWAMMALISGAVIAGFVVSRTIGLPGGADDIGNWGEPLAVSSLFVEGCMFALGAYKYFSKD